jgi:hypothetical protein
MSTSATIIIKNGTGSAVPTSLQQGELAINVDSGSLYYGSGSGNAVKSDFTFKYNRPIQNKRTSGELLLSDKGTYNRCGSHLLTIPLNSSVDFPIGTEIDFIQTSSVGHLMVTASAGQSITINSRNSLYSASGQFSAISCKKVGSDEWDLIGDLTK